MNQQNKQRYVAVKRHAGHWMLFFVLLGFTLRLQQLSFQPLWGDEGWSFYFASQTFPQLLTLTAIDIHPPLYYILLKSWLAMVGVGAQEARLFSVMVGTLLIPVMGILGQRLFDKRVGIIATALTALMPMAVYYAQEVRMYGLITLLGALSTYFLVRAIESQPIAWDGYSPFLKQQIWSIAYLVTATAALYTVYYAAFILFFQGLYLLLSYFQQPQRLFRRLIPFAVIGLLYLPWVIYVTPRLISYIEHKRDVENYIPLGFLRFFGDHFVAFTLGHLPENLQKYAWITLVGLLLALIGFVVAKKTWRLLLGLYLFGPMGIVFIINLNYPFTPPFFERTLLLVAPAYWLFIALGLIWLWQRQSWPAIAAVAVLLVGSVISFTSFYILPRYPAEDYRPLLEDIAARATGEDTILGSYQWQIGLYYAYLPSPRPKLFAVPGWGQGWSSAADNADSLIADVSEILNHSPRLWFPAYQASGHIWEDEAEVALAELGHPALLEWHSPQTKLTLVGTSQLPQHQAPTTNFEDSLILLEATVGGEKYQAGRDIVPVTLLWHKQSNPDNEHRVNLRLIDAAGRTWATRDSQPRAGQVPFSDITLGDTLLDKHGLLTPAGAPPASYRLMLSVRQVNNDHPLDLVDETGQPLGAELQLAEITLITPHPPVGSTALPVQVETDVIFGQQAKLVGYTLGQGKFKAGETMPLTLFWESLIDSPGPLEILVELRDETGQSYLSYQQAPIWPSTEWQTGTILRDPHDVALPPTLTPADYQLFISLLSSEGSLLTPQYHRLKVNSLSPNLLGPKPEEELLLTTITTIDRSHNFESPAPQNELAFNFNNQAKLMGLDLPQTQVSPGDSINLTLHWHALATLDRSWTVFIHLTDTSGQIVSQADQIPGGGQFPTTGWLPNEFLADHYNLPIPADTPAGMGPYHLNIGLYDANNFTRLPLVEANEIIDDHAVLESWPISVE